MTNNYNTEIELGFNISLMQVIILQSHRIGGLLVKRSQTRWPRQYERTYLLVTGGRPS